MRILKESHVYTMPDRKLKSVVLVPVADVFQARISASVDKTHVHNHQ